jgi:hypothetical protein
MSDKIPKERGAPADSPAKWLCAVGKPLEATLVSTQRRKLATLPRWFVIIHQKSVVNLASFDPRPRSDRPVAVTARGRINASLTVI